MHPIFDRPLVIDRLEARKLLDAELSGSISLETGIFDQGETVSFVVDIENTGDADAVAPFDIKLRLSGNAKYGGFDDLSPGITLTQATDLAMGAKNTFNVNFVLPAGIKANPYHIVGKVDLNEVVDEDDEFNNTFGSDGVTIDVLSDTHQLAVYGTGAADRININYTGTQFSTTFGTEDPTTYDTKVQGLLLYAGGGNDVINILDDAPNCNVYGDAGDDKITDTAAANTLHGGAGKDQLYGGIGNDEIRGDGGNDKLYGEAGLDKLYGGDGNDILDGGSSTDRLRPGNGADLCYGQGGDDLFYSTDADLLIDSLFGGSGNDNASASAEDVQTGIEGTST